MGDVREKKNLKMIQKLLPGASAILDKAQFVAVYGFNEEEQAWEREEIEGPLFLVERSPGAAGRVERFALVVVNRAASANLVQYVGEGFESDASDQYLMFRGESGIYGLWFPEKEERERFAAELDQASSGAPGPEAVQDVQAALQTMMHGSATEAVPKSFGDGAAASANFELSKEQMKDVLLRLVQTDKFVDILHATYLKSVRSKAGDGAAQAPQAPQPMAMPHHASANHHHPHHFAPPQMHVPQGYGGGSAYPPYYVPPRPPQNIFHGVGLPPQPAGGHQVQRPPQS